jgi:translocation and assembly module TamB
VRDPAGSPATEARLTVAGLQAGGIGGGLRLDATGPEDALAVKLAANLTGVGGADLAAQAAATLDTPAQTLSVATLQSTWKGETLRLLGPARVAFADGVAVDRLRLGVRQAVLDIAGRLSPTLDLTASLRNVTADLARIVLPDLQADGRLEADATLAGTPSKPTGTVRVAANGMRLTNGAAAGLPVAALAATATLQGETARLDATLTAGRNRLHVAGTAPLDPAGAMDLRGTGEVDLATLDPILAAEGRRARGRISLDATVAGTIAAPQANGTLRLTGGSVQDVRLGARLEAIEATIQATGESIRIANFTARAGKGTLSAGGTVGLAAPMPLDLTLTARNATPLSSDLLTAVLDADLTLRGEALGQMALAGRIVIPRADIRIPERLPGTLAVLDVRRPGEKPPPPPGPPPDITLDLAVSSPGRIFVRGRGVDAELAGDLRIGGTAAVPRPEGGFKLRRGQFSLAGQTLNFTTGEVSFDGSGKIDPTLNFVATSSNASVTASVAVTGYASAPRITLSSVPELPQDEVLSWLLFRQSASKLSPLQLAQIAQALAQISGVGGGFDPLNALRTGLGLDRLSVGSGEGGRGASVEAGRYVSDRVYVGARQGTSGSGSTQGVVQVDLMKGLKLEATVGQNQPSATGTGSSTDPSGTSVGLRYQFEY